MRLLDRYIAKQILVSSLFAVAVIIVILVLGNVFKEILRELAKRPDLSIMFVLKFIVLVIPISLSLAIPFSFLTSILLTFGRLSADSEFVSMRMAGLSMWRICLPVALVAMFFTAICAWVNLSVTPAAKNEMEGMKDSLINLVKREPMLLFPNQSVMTELPEHLIYARKEDGVLRGFQMIKMVDNLPQAVAIAKEARVTVDLEAESPELLVVMDDVNLLVPGQGGDMLQSTQPIFMKEATVGVSIASFDSGDEDVSDQPENMGLRRLFEKVGDESLPAETRAMYRTQLSMRFAFSVSCITFGLIGVPLGITAQRRESTAGFVLSMVIAVTYYVMLTVAQIMQSNEKVYPHLLVWVPNILFLGIGIAMFAKLAKR